MGVRLQQTIYDGNGQSWTIKVHDASYSNTPIPVDIVEANIQYQPTAREMHSPILTSVSQITTRIDGAILESFVTDFIGAPERRFRLQIDKGADLFWVGLILTDNVSKEDSQWPYHFSFQATDGLATLKEVDYNNNGTDYSGKQRCTEHVMNCLNKLGTDDLFDTTLLSTACLWYSENHSSTSIDPFHESRFDHRRFIKIDTTGSKSYTSCYDVLKQLCEAWAARLILTDGSFKIIQVNEYEGANFALFNYDNAASVVSTTAAATYRKTDATDVIRIKGGNFQYFPALRRAVINFQHFQSQSIIPPDAVRTSLFTVPDIDSGGATSKVLFSVKYSYASDFPIDFVPHRHKMSLNIRIGSYYLKREAVINSLGQITYIKAFWTTTFSTYEFFTGLITEDASTTYAEIPPIISPPIPEDGNLTISANLGIAYDENGLLIQQQYQSIINWYDAYMEIVVGGTLESRANQMIYESENTQTNNTAKKELTTVIGDAPSLIALGALEVHDGSAWVAPSSWSVGSTASGEAFGQLLAQELILVQAYPAEIINAEYNGLYTPIHSIYRENKDHMPLGININLVSGKTNGQFVRIDSTNASAIDKNPKSQFELSDELLNPRTPSGPIQVQDPASGQAANQALIERLISYKTRTDIGFGDPVTEIPINTRSVEGVIKNGDTIEVINTVTGESQNFTASADVLANDDRVQVESTTAEHDFVVDSVVAVPQSEVLRKINSATQKKRYVQAFYNHNSSLCTITENGGTLPAASYVDVELNGSALAPTDWSINGSDIEFSFTATGTIVVKFWIDQAVIGSARSRYVQAFYNHNSSLCTVTENGGTLPAASYVDVELNGSTLAPTDWSINGSDIEFSFTATGTIVVKFWI